MSEIKQELSDLPPKKILELCLQLARYKKDNKELLTYLLFESHDVDGFVQRVRQEIDEYFTQVPKAPYQQKKFLRKILRLITKYSRYTGRGEPAIEMLLHFCITLKSSEISLRRNAAILKLYEQQLKKIAAMLEDIHEDLHYDYKKKLEELNSISDNNVSTLSFLLKKIKGVKHSI